jgi:hypothetical protein
MDGNMKITNTAKHNDPTEAVKDVERRQWQTPDMEIIPVSVTASGRGAQCEGSIFTNTS